MKIYIAILLLFSLVSCNQQASKFERNKPNIIYILADDLGYGELGVYGQEKIETPNIDQLAKEGMIFTQHYTAAPVCAPARNMLLTGKHSGHSYVRGNDEDGTRGNVWDFQAMLDDPKLEGQRPIPDSIITLGEVLQTAGYTTACVGKWGLGAPESEGVPNAQGFDYFYGYNCQRQAHNLFPTHLWENDKRVYLENEFLAPHVQRAPAEGETEDEFFETFHQKEYAPTAIHNAAKKFIESHTTKPFFLYYASPLPHVPLQAPKRWVKHYQKKFGPEEAYVGKSYFPNQTPRATYAAMISYLDEQVGDLVKQLKEVGLYENTLILFTSDNGPTYAGGADTPYFDSAQPFSTVRGRGKGYLYEGGIRVPMIAHWPKHISASSRSDHPSAFYDVMPTLCELTNTSAPPNDGISFLPTLLSKEQAKHPYLYWEFPEYNGQQAVRWNNWKGIRQNMHDGNLVMELYDLSKDSIEQNNLAADRPDIVEKMEAIMREEHVPSPFERFQFTALGDGK